ncbi:MAG: hypothetical protein V1857_06285, partial [archaeon]
LNISLLKAPDFNEKLRERGCKPTVTIQGVCRAARDENQVREVLESIWQRPTDAEKIVADITRRNEELYRFERTLGQGARKEEKPIMAP